MTDTDQEIKKIFLWFLTLAKRAVQLGMIIVVLWMTVLGVAVAYHEYERYAVAQNPYLKDLEEERAKSDPNYCKMPDGSYAENMFCKYVNPNKD